MLVDDQEIKRIQDFIADSWSVFVAFIGDADEAERIYQAIGGEGE